MPTRWDEVPWWYPDDHLCTGPVEADDPSPGQPPRETPGDRPSYAVPPLGETPDLREELPPRPSRIVDAINWFHVTNLGSLLDVLA